VMVTHEARAAAIADRILFLADGQIVRELGKQADQAEVLAVMNSLSA
jgi:putative ABC transport system ATP-binding protein